MRAPLDPTYKRPRLDELRYLYQPVVPLTGGQAWSEALIRWQLKDGTVRGPLDILPYWLVPSRLEKFTRFTLERAARTAASHPSAHVSVNLSPAQVLLPSTLTILEGMHAHVRSRLYLELTEQVFTDSGALAARLRLLKQRCGVILLDDVTPADLQARLRFDSPVDGVKVDRSVVQALLGDPHQAIGRSAAKRFVTEAVARFPLVVAEGIEDPNACEELKALGVSHVQGFGIALPAPELRTDAGTRALARALDGVATASASRQTGIGMIMNRKPTDWQPS